MTYKDKKVLVVEDDEDLRKVLIHTIEEAGPTVLNAADGEHGLELALKDHPDVILLDLVLPKMNGITLIKKLRQDEWGKNVPVIVLTNYDETENVADVLEAGAQDYMVKTVSLKEIVTKVKQKLDR